MTRSAASVGWAWDKVIQGIYTWFANGLLMLMEWVWSVLDTATTPRLTEDWFASGLVQPLAAISLGDHGGDDARLGDPGRLRRPAGADRRRAEGGAEGDRRDGADGRR